jgi:hypothetical protein
MWQAEHEKRCELCGIIIKSMDYFPYQLKHTEYRMPYTLCDKCSESLCKWVERRMKLNKSVT